MRFAVNVSIIFTELPLLDRFTAAAAAGFHSVECWWPFPSPTPSTADVDGFLAAIDASGTQLVALNFYAGDMPAGERGVIAHPDRVEQFRASVPILQRIAAATGCRRFNALYGQQHHPIAIENLRYAVDSVDGTVLLEPLTAGENGDYPLHTAADAFAVIEQVPDLRLLLDVYHLTNNGDDVVSIIDNRFSAIGHVQIADVPGRGQPGTGTLDFTRIFAALERHGYDGFVGCEYRPQGPSEQSFGWLRRDTQ